MKICLLGEFSGKLDEGMRIVSFNLVAGLSSHNQILTVDLRNIFLKSSWINIKRFDPDIIHYLHGPSLLSFIILKLISLMCPSSKTVMSAMHPSLTSISKIFIPFLRPNVVLVQSYQTEKMLNLLRCETKFFPCGVDVNRFKPIGLGVKEELREKYRIDKSLFIILHIGSIKEGRNIRLLKSLQGKNNQVLIIGANSVGVDSKVMQDLIESGCNLRSEYIDKIEEIYNLSDCYIYPTIKKYDLFGNAKADSIEMPLTVLEAMSCNLPVISTKFGALPRIFRDGGGLCFINNNDDIISCLTIIKEIERISTREKVLPYSWENIIYNLNKIYYELIR